MNDSAKSAPFYTDAIQAACERVENSSEQTDAKLSEFSSRLDELAKRCEDLASKNSELSAALSRAYALDDAGGFVSFFKVENPAKFKLNF